MAIVAADCDAAAAMVTTRNQVVGAPVIRARRVWPKGCGRMRAMVINAGNSNVCTGAAGVRDADAMAARTAKLLGTTADKVMVASTGIIGHRLPMDKVRNGIDDAAASLGKRYDSAALQAIMTTDTHEKSAVVQARIDRKVVTVAGMAKGSGMIAPSMATMISVITTDAAVTPAALKKALVDATAVSFNALTVDSDTSTSDTVVVMASGRAGNKPISTRSPGYKRFASTLKEVCGELARQIVADGEGATKVIEIAVRNARSQADAEIAAKSVANSPLFKCAVHGCDPNWGRIVVALGKSAAKIDPDKLRVKIGPTTVFARGGRKPFDARKLSKYLASNEVQISCDLGLGKGAFTALTCDLSREYITINADYHT